jgi:hypothetical protein
MFKYKYAKILKLKEVYMHAIFFQITSHIIVC